MRNLSLFLACIVVASLNAILLLGAGTTGNVIGRSEGFGALVLVMDVSLVASSCLLVYLFWRARRVAWFVAFVVNLISMLVALMLKLGGFTLSPLVLFGADLYWLNLYLVCLTSEWRWFRGKA